MLELLERGLCRVMDLEVPGTPGLRLWEMLQLVPQVKGGEGHPQGIHSTSGPGRETGEL